MLSRYYFLGIISNDFCRGDNVNESLARSKISSHKTSFRKVFNKKVLFFQKVCIYVYTYIKSLSANQLMQFDKGLCQAAFEIENYAACDEPHDPMQLGVVQHRFVLRCNR